jgi:hypothetical protein
MICRSHRCIVQTVSKLSNLLSKCPNHSEKLERLYLSYTNNSQDELDKWKQKTVNRLNRWHQNITGRCNEELQL